MFASVIPDKGYYLAEQSGHLAMDYDRLYELVEIGMPWAAQVDLRDSLSAGDYYRTDTHWRLEKDSGLADRLGLKIRICSGSD